MHNLMFDLSMSSTVMSNTGVAEFLTFDFFSLQSSVVTYNVHVYVCSISAPF